MSEMSRPRLVAQAALVWLLSVPAAWAQGQRHSHNGAPHDTASLALWENASRLASANPLRVLLQNRDTLHLSDDQLTQLRELNLRFEERQRPLAARVDTLHRRSGSDGWLPSMQRDSLSFAVGRLDMNVRAAADSGFGLLSANQLQVAQYVIERDKRLRERPQNIGTPTIMAPGAPVPPE